MVGQWWRGPGPTLTPRFVGSPAGILAGILERSPAGILVGMLERSSAGILAGILERSSAGMLARWPVGIIPVGIVPARSPAGTEAGSPLALFEPSRWAGRAPPRLTQLGGPPRAPRCRRIASVCLDGAPINGEQNRSPRSRKELKKRGLEPAEAEDRVGAEFHEVQRVKSYQGARLTSNLRVETAGFTTSNCFSRRTGCASIFVTGTWETVGTCLTNG